MIHCSIRTPGNATHTKSGSARLMVSANDSLVGLREGPKRRAKHADNFDIRLQLDQHASQLDEAFLGITEKEMAPGPRCVPQRVSHEIRTVYAVLEAGSTKVERPNDRHPVRQHQVEPGQDPGEFGVVPGLAKDVGVGGADRCGPRFTSERLDSLQRGIVSGTSDRRSQKPDGFQRSIGWIRGIGLRGAGGSASIGFPLTIAMA